jgi:hypothetical protein
VSYTSQFISKFDVVVYLAIKDDHDPSIVAGHRLRAAFNVDDGEATVAEGDMVATVFGVASPKAGAIRSPVRKTIGQAFEDVSTRLPIRR